MAELSFEGNKHGFQVHTKLQLAEYRLHAETTEHVPRKLCQDRRRVRCLGQDARPKADSRPKARFAFPGLFDEEVFLACTQRYRGL